MSNKIITIKNLFKTFKNTKALNGLSFNVNKGTCFCFLGPNGAGKSTLIKILYGINSFDNNPNTNIDVFGFSPLTNKLNIKYLSGVVPQDNNLDEELNVSQNLYVYSKFYGLKKKQSLKKISELLEFLELNEKKNERIRTLSGGMKRRLVIARALLNNPKLLMLDEPTTGLDPQVRHVIWDKIRQLKNRGTTILLTTHYMDEAFQIADKILIMDKGKKILEGKPHNLLSEHIEKYVLEIKKVINKNELKINLTNVRIDSAGEFTFLHSNNINILKQIRDKFNVNETYLRQSNLEDLFLKMTGRILNEKQ